MWERTALQLDTTGTVSVALATQQAEEMAQVYTGMVKAMKGRADAANMENAAETEIALHEFSQVRRQKQKFLCARQAFGCTLRE